MSWKKLFVNEEETDSKKEDVKKAKAATKSTRRSIIESELKKIKPK